MRPAVVGGLINGLAIATPVLVGVVLSAPAAGATACLGAYVAAFTNKGGPRGHRTAGLLVAAVINSIAFGAGKLTATLWPVALTIVAILVFAAAMGDTFGATVARCGTMPATAFLAGMGGTGVGQPVAATALVAAGGSWYAMVTMALTTKPRLRQVTATVGQLYADLAGLVPDPAARGADARHRAAVASLRRAETAVVALATPDGDEVLAAQEHELVRIAERLVDALAALHQLGWPTTSIAGQYAAVMDALRARIGGVGRIMTRGWIRHAAGSGTGPHLDGFSAALSDFERACDGFRENAASGLDAYRCSADAAQYRRRLTAIAEDVDAAAAHAIAVSEQPNRAVDPGSGHGTARQRRRPREIFSLSSSTYRHAVRETAIVTMLFTVISVASLPHGEWAVLAVLRVLRPQYGATTQRIWQRVIGNVIGGSCVAAVLASTHSPSVLAAMLFVIVTVGFALRPVNYAFWVVFGTPLILLIGDLSTPGDWRDALARVAMTVLGSVVAITGFVVILPTWEADRLPRLLETARDATVDYLDSVIAGLGAPTGDASVRTASVRTARQAAEQALTSATECHRRALREPRHRPSGTATRTLNLLRQLNFQLDAVAAQPEPPPTPVPSLDRYRDHATTALRASSAKHAATHTAALHTAVEQMLGHLRTLQQARLAEVESEPDSQTTTRTTIRTQQPTIAQLAGIAETIAALASDKAPTRR